MDLAYDHIQESALSPDETAENGGKKPVPSTLNTDFQEAYRAISSSPWGARLGGFFGSVVKQVSFYAHCSDSVILTITRARMSTGKHSRS
jgi:hypothetical protein